jgi:uncharacterized protein (TIGR02996 family)
MADEETFIRAIVLSPHDTSLRLVYADWLEERGDYRGEFLRLWAKLENPEGGETEADACRQRLQDLQSQYGSPDPMWVALLDPTPRSFRRIYAQQVAKSPLGVPASDPAMARLSDAKLRRFHPELYSFWGLVYALVTGEPVNLRSVVKEHLYHGDSRAAVVVSVAPLLVSAYTDEFDSVVLLKFPNDLVQEYGLAIGSRLLTSNTYQLASDPRLLAVDLLDGPRSHLHWDNFSPRIAEFLSDDILRIEKRKAEISAEEWQCAHEMGMERLARNVPCRDGRPLLCGVPAW